jgi:hypothetical protein
MLLINSPLVKVRVGSSSGGCGYLECQLCGHLTPGFERSKQKMHFHEEHPLLPAVLTYKYVLRSSGQGGRGHTAAQQQRDLAR